MCDGTLSVYHVVADLTQKENQLLLTYNLIHSCKCKEYEFHDESSELVLNIIDIVEKHAIQKYITYYKVVDPEDCDIIYARSCLANKYNAYKALIYNYFDKIKYVYVHVLFPWR